MKHLKKAVVFLVVLALGIGSSSVMAEAKTERAKTLKTEMVSLYDGEGRTSKAKTLKTESLSLYDGESRTIKTPKKIKGIYEKDSVCHVKKTGAREFKITIPEDCSDSELRSYYCGQFRERYVVTYIDGSSQTYVAKVTCRYAEKVVEELKLLLADPDKSLREMEALYYPGDFVGTGNGATFYVQHLEMHLLKNTEKGINECLSSSSGNGQNLNLDEALKDMTMSQKEAAVLGLYFQGHMEYDVEVYEGIAKPEPGTRTFEALYKGIYKGICGESAGMVEAICRMLGYKVKLFESDTMKEPHGWACIPAVDKEGNRYWQGIQGSAFACNVKWDYKSSGKSWGIILDVDKPENYYDYIESEIGYEPYYDIAIW